MEILITDRRSIDGRTALVTGAASGIGAATVKAFVQCGANVIATDILVPGAESFGFDDAKSEARILTLPLDVSDADQINSVVKTGAAHFDGLEFIVNNAGFNAILPFEDKGFGDIWEKSLAVMLTGPKDVIHASLPFLRKSDCARIVNIASIEGLEASKGSAAYASAKAGLIGLTRAIAVEFGTEGITANCICPGPIETNMTAHVSHINRKKYLDRYTALQRPGQAEEVADMVVNLCLPSSSFVTGSIITVDGGLVARST